MGLKNEFETALVNELSVFKPLMFYCSLKVCSYLVSLLKLVSFIQIETESNKKVLANLEKITADYQQMKKENSALIAKVKGHS